MPPLDEGDMLYMPSALPGLSAGKAAEVLQQTDRLIRQVPEVQSVFGKAGRAETATDPAPMEMFETTVQFKPHDQWRPGMTTAKPIEELDQITNAIGGENIGETIEGLQRFPINVRYPREVRDSVEKLRELPVVTDRGAQIPLGAVTQIGFVDGPPMLKSENARLSGWVYVDIH